MLVILFSRQLLRLFKVYTLIIFPNCHEEIAMFGDVPQDPKKSRMKRIIQFPVSRMIIGVAFVMGAMISGNIVVVLIRRLISDAEKPSDPWMVLLFVVMTLMSIWGYYTYVRLIEKRQLIELSRTGALKELGIGCTIGFGLMATTIFILWILGYYEVAAVSSLMVLLLPFFDGIRAGFFEEILFRGVIFRILNEKLGSWLAIIISALFFGFAHSGNPNSSFYSGVAIALEAGILLSAIYLYTRRLWMVIGVHFAWNFTLGGIFGVTVSGQESEGLLQSTLSGPDIITGGAFGVETSIIALIVCLIAGIYFIHRVREQGHFTQPFWHRPKKIKSETEQ
jgi:membrane protease YdiL (CAAX protease family)